MGQAVDRRNNKRFGLEGQLRRSPTGLAHANETPFTIITGLELLTGFRKGMNSGVGLSTDVCVIVLFLITLSTVLLSHYSQ